MSIQDIFLTGLTSSVIITIFLSVIGFLGRSIIERWLSRNLEKYKGELQAAHEKELETLRLEISEDKYKFETKHKLLFEKQIEVLTTLYNFLVSAETERRGAFNKLKDKINKGMSIEDIKLDDLYDDNGETFTYLWTTANDFLNQNRIYFSEELCQKLENAITDALLFDITLSAFVIDEENLGNSPLDLQALIMRIKKSGKWEFIKNLLDKFHFDIVEVEKEFREITAVHDE